MNLVQSFFSAKNMVKPIAFCLNSNVKSFTLKFSKEHLLADKLHLLRKTTKQNASSLILPIECNVTFNGEKTTICLLIVVFFFFCIQTSKAAFEQGMQKAVTAFSSLNKRILLNVCKKKKNQ